MGALLVIAHDAAVVGVEGLADLVTDPVHRVPGVHGALEDHRDVLPSPLAHLLGAEVQQVLAVEANLTGDELGVGGQQAKQREGDRGLAAAGLADQADRLALVDRERHVLDGGDFAGLDLVVHDQPIHLEQRPGGIDLSGFQVLEGLRCRGLGDAHPRARSRGLITSSMPRPTMKNAKHRNDTASPAGKSSHQ